MSRINTFDHKSGCKFQPWALSILLLAFSLDNLNGQSEALASNSTTLESFFEHTPVIRKLIYERVSAVDGRRQNYLLKSDGMNAFLSPVNQTQQPEAMATGQFGSIFWHYYAGNKILVLVDSKLNQEVLLPHFPLRPELRGKPFDDGGANGELEHNMLKREMWEVLNLGLPEADRDRELRLEKEQNRIQAFASVLWGLPHVNEGHPVVIELKYEGGVPVAATFKDPAYGRTRISVTYKYNGSFYGGRFPVEFTKFLMSASVGDGNDTPEFTVRIHELELSSRSLPDAEMDPREVFKSENLRLHVWSNNVAYEVTPRGLAKVLTSEEVVKRNQEIGARRHPTSLWASRSILSVVCASAVICLILFIRQGRRRKNIVNQKRNKE